MNRSIERMLKSGEITLDELKPGRKAEEMTRERARGTAEDLLRRAGWRLSDADRVGNHWEISSQAANVAGDGHRMDIGISFDLDASGKPRNIEISGYLADGTELKPRRVSRLVSPRDAGRQLSP